jgi:hypothetical protein
MTTPTELQALALKIARHRWPDAKIHVSQYYDDILVMKESGEDKFFNLDEVTAYRLWQEIAPKFVEKLLNTRYAQLEYAKADAYEASLTPLGIAKAYCEVYGLED